jgi:hypothetical protein
MNSWQAFSSICQLSLHSSNCFLWCTLVFQLDAIPFVNLFLIFWAIGVLFRKVLTFEYISKYFPCFPTVLTVFHVLCKSFWSILKWFCTRWEIGVQFQSFTCGYSAFLIKRKCSWNTHVEEAVFFQWMFLAPLLNIGCT